MAGGGGTVPADPLALGGGHGVPAKSAFASEPGAIESKAGGAERGADFWRCEGFGEGQQEAEPILEIGQAALRAEPVPVEGLTAGEDPRESGHESGFEIRMGERSGDQQGRVAGIPRAGFVGEARVSQASQSGGQRLRRQRRKIRTEGRQRQRGSREAEAPGQFAGQARGDGARPGLDLRVVGLRDAKAARGFGL